MVCSVWGLASINDQGENSTEGGKGKNGGEKKKLFHCDAKQTQSPGVNVSNSRTWYWDLRAERLDHTLFEMSGWLIVFHWRELGLYTYPARLIHLPSSIFTCNLTDRGCCYSGLGWWFKSTTEVVFYWYNWWDLMFCRHDSFVGVTSRCTYSSCVGF